MVEANAASNTCAHCASLTFPREERMSALGFGRCRHQPVWRYQSPHASCYFEPSRFSTDHGSHISLSDTLRDIRKQRRAAA